ncbi:Fic family protein [Teredinibacter purpureus]|uniref:Fic family protein n=1 Tax=Teredinibacter purpureus TaxID=2731756 RepID=UPI000695D00B|nr:Fic family protein [Teredinibacter purpureus]
MKYCWQHPDWPNFTYNDREIRNTLYSYALESGRLSGGVGQLKESLQNEAYIGLMVNEAIKTSQIEGEILDSEDVRSSIKNFLGLSNPPTRVIDPKAEGISALMVDLRKTYTEPLSKEKLCHWHQLVLPPESRSLLQPNLQIGQWRTTESPMQIVSGPIGYEQVHYEAPPSHQVDEEMSRFLKWYNDSSPLNPHRKENLSGPERSAIAHLWFESIHPFDDGNGRVGRAIAEQALAQDAGGPALLSLSSAIERNKKEYYEQLHQASKPEMNVTPWVNWFCDTVMLAQKEALNKVQFVLQKARFWNDNEEKDLNVRQVKAINKVFNAGIEGFQYGISAKKYMGMTGCSKATATRDLAELVQKGCLTPLEKIGRNARYELNLSGGALKLESQGKRVATKVEDQGFSDRVKEWKTHINSEESTGKSPKLG